ncbi:MAG: thioredoxin domain-containing protein [Chloroflexi bacterium]|nr:thioredoxin domain-containing protein [Chloroflexota bacterium]
MKAPLGLMLNSLIAMPFVTSDPAAATVDALPPLDPVNQSNPALITNKAMPAHTNRLAREPSPYLRQHQHNPVDWFAWGEEAFAKARRENKPIFLSIGYSTCHWCHVMERESFESTAVADFLNRHFVSIKVDREERPDVDKIYMTAMQAMGQGGGWPLNVFLAPDLKPFYGGTYFPPESKYGRPGFLQLLQQIQQLWQTRQSDLKDSAVQLHQRLSSLMETEPGRSLILTPALLHHAARQVKEEYDPRHGGFGSAPKFPRPSQPLFLLRYGVRFRDAEAVRMVLHTCERMAAGGICDQLGGGFARYSVDAEWLVPHFEKMLYDNAQLVHLYLDAYRVSGEQRQADAARDILRYVLRDMTHSEGGFYSAEDADSEGKEGKFYCWTRAELAQLLTPEEFKAAARYFGVTEKGNFVDHSDPNPLPNQNVLSIADPKLAIEERPLLAAAREKMFRKRAQRIRPHLDDKILASWNGMMLEAVARACAVLGDDAYRTAAEKNLAFLQAKLWDAGTKTLYHRWRAGERDSVQLLDAYAKLLAGVIELYEATLDSKHLEFALALAESMMARFYDAEKGGFWQSAAQAPDLILRVKEDYDGAEPSGNSVAILALLKLSAITDRADLKKAAEQSLRLFAERLQTLPQAVPHLLLALDFWLEEPKRVVLTGDAVGAAGRQLLRAAHSVYQPNKVVLGNTGPVEAFAKTLPPYIGGPVVYLCTGTACQPPTRYPGKVKKLLQGN